MISSSISVVLEPLAGKLQGSDVTFTGVSIDTRTLNSGNLYFAISGENFDGHTFCAQAVDAGAVALVVEQEQNIAIPQLLVKNCRTALRDLAIFWRDQFDIPIVAVTGSSGKTTVKEMISSIFSQYAKTLATRGNLNNDLGVPLTLLSLSKDDRLAVIEIGANHVGEIEKIVKYVRPTIAVITMIGPSHLEGFGTIEAIASAKSEIYSGLQAGGVAVINRDDHFFDTMRDAANSQVLTFGLNAEADVTVETEDAAISLVTPKGRAKLALKLLGAHNQQNALAATAAAIAANIQIDSIVAGLESLEPVFGRLQLRTDIKEFKVIDDTYNANPASTKAAIDVLDGMLENKCLVLGDMAELGVAAPELHRQVGEYARRADKQLFCIGSYSRDIAEGFGDKTVVCENMDALFAAFLDQVGRGSSVLVKGSRSTGMERFIERLSEREASNRQSGDVSL